MIKFKKEYEDAEIHIPSKRLIINRFNIHQPEIQRIVMKYPKYAHNFEPVEGGGVEGGTMLESDDTGESESLQPVKKEVVSPPVKEKKTKSASKKQGGSKK